MDKRLMRSLHFKIYELPANQRGIMTERQKNLLRLLFQYERVALLSPAIIILMGMVSLIFNLKDDIDDLALILGIHLPYIAVPIAFVARILLQERDDILLGRVDSVKGTLHRIASRTKTDYGRIYKVKVENKVFKVNYHTYHAFIEGQIYALYYAPHTRTILSAERVGEFHGNHPHD